MGEASHSSQGAAVGFPRERGGRSPHSEEEQGPETVAVAREQEGALRKRFRLAGAQRAPEEGDVAQEEAEEEGDGDGSEEEEQGGEENPPLLVSQLKSLFQGEHPEAPKLPQARLAPPGNPEKPCMLPVRCPPRAPKSPRLGPRSASPPSPVPSRRALPRSTEAAAAEALDSTEHEWLVRATSGEWSPQLHGLLLRDRSLANKGDFLTGFTVLHWAAKSGSCETLRKVLEVAGKEGGRVDVDARSHGGYTPLHIAALHGREEAVALLVREGGAQVGLRDYSGRRPFQYLREGASFAARHLLRDPALHARAHAHAPTLKKSPKVAASILSSTSTVLGLLSDDTAFYELTKGLKKPASFNKFLTAATAPRRKLKARATFSSYSSLAEAVSEEEAEESAPPAAPTKRRPMSELFFGH